MHPTAVTAVSTLRRTAAAILRGGDLGPEHTKVIRKLALNPHTALRLVVGFASTGLGLRSAQITVAELADIGVEVSAEELLAVWHTAYAITDRTGHGADRTELSVKAARANGADAAEELRRDFMGAFDAVRRSGMTITEQAAGWHPIGVRKALLHLLGTEVHDIPNLLTTVRGWLAPEYRSVTQAA